MPVTSPNRTEFKATAFKATHIVALLLFFKNICCSKLMSSIFLTFLKACCLLRNRGWQTRARVQQPSRILSGSLIRPEPQASVILIAVSENTSNRSHEQRRRGAVKLPSPHTSVRLTRRPPLFKLKLLRSPCCYVVFASRPRKMCPQPPLKDFCVLMCILMNTVAPALQ